MNANPAVVISDPVKKVAENARAPKPGDKKLASRLKAEANSALPIEADAKTKLLAKAKQVGDTDPSAVLRQFPEAKLLDNSAFTMRRPDTKLPTLAPFSLEDPDVSMGNGTEGFSEHFPVSLKHLYKDVDGVLNGRREGFVLTILFCLSVITFLFLWSKAWYQIGFSGSPSMLGTMTIVLTPVVWFLVYKDWHFLKKDSSSLSWEGRILSGIMLSPLCMPTVISMLVYTLLDKVGMMKAREIRVRFGGLLPGEIRTLARKAKESRLFSEVFIVAEVPKWQIKETDTPMLSRPGDPLLVGHEGGRYWLLATFDVTAVEDYVAKEHATNPNV